MMSDCEREALGLGVDPAWLAERMRTIGRGRCPTCWPDHDIIVEGDYIEPCYVHIGNNDVLLASPDDTRVTAPPVKPFDIEWPEL